MRGACSIGLISARDRDARHSVAGTVPGRGPCFRPGEGTRCENKVLASSSWTPHDEYPSYMEKPNLQERQDLTSTGATG